LSFLIGDAMDELIEVGQRIALTGPREETPILNT